MSVLGLTRNVRRLLLTPKAIAAEPKLPAAISPPMKPPPGSLCPRSRTEIEKSNSSGSSKRVAVERISEVIFQFFVASAEKRIDAYTGDGENSDLAEGVSNPRKSTSMTLTMFLPCASDKLFSIKCVEILGYN